MKTEIKKARLILGYTQRAMAENANINTNTYKAWEQGRCIPNLEHINKLCEMLTKKGYKNEAKELRNKYINYKLDRNIDYNIKDVKRYNNL